MSSSGYIQSNAIGNTYVNPAIVTGALPINMTPQESGKVTFINSTAAAAAGVDLVINLGLVSMSAGLHYKFIYNSFSANRLVTNTIHIVSYDITGAPTDVLRVLVNGNTTAATGSSVGDVYSTTLNLVLAAAGITGISIGDTLDCYCDGETWFIYASVYYVGALTVA